MGVREAAKGDLFVPGTGRSWLGCAGRAGRLGVRWAELTGPRVSGPREIGGRSRAVRATPW